MSNERKVGLASGAYMAMGSALAAAAVWEPDGDAAWSMLLAALMWLVALAIATSKPEAKP